MRLMGYDVTWVRNHLKWFAIDSASGGGVGGSPHLLVRIGASSASPLVITIGLRYCRRRDSSTVDLGALQMAVLASGSP